MKYFSHIIQLIRRLKRSVSTIQVTGANRSSESAKRFSSQALSGYLESHYEFRFNVLTEQSEFRPQGQSVAAFRPLGKRELNTLCLEVQSAGIRCWDRDLARYLHSLLIADYHPFRLYVEELPAWDGTDRLTDLAERVSKAHYWVKHFHRWMLAMTAQWMGLDERHANSVAPLLVSEEQGWLKSTFCKSLVPEPLQAYYTDCVQLTADAGINQKLALMGLINLDEFDRFSAKQLVKLKNLMQLPALNIRRAHQSYYRVLPRIASFIGTSNRKDLLADPSGSRRFLCVEVEQKIDCSNIELDQIYAQLKAELLQGARYWFTSEDEHEIQEVNASFYQVMPEEELFRMHFRAAGKEEEAEMLSLVDIVEELRRHHRGLLSSLSFPRFGAALVAAGVERVHTRRGNLYRVVRTGEGCEG